MYVENLSNSAMEIAEELCQELIEESPGFLLFSGDIKRKHWLEMS